ncbi:MAG: histidinol dehydrogenase [Alphaproteobacteria bacterium]|jgi:histidinol dehydrogenase
MPTILDASQIGFEADLKKILDNPRGLSQDVSDIVRTIIDTIKQNGDDALVNYTRQFDDDQASLETLTVTQQALDAAEKLIDEDLKNALKLAYRRITLFHQKLLPDHIFYKDDTGTHLGVRYTPLDSAGVYIPGGSANYPSSVLMNIIPAKIAGVKRIVAVVPAPKGIIDPLVLYALKLAGADEIYKVGGAQAIAALAYGTQTIQAVDKITGPGNAYVAEAKKQVFGSVGIDSIAGPSEILIIADQGANPYHTAIDLLSQAEHDALAQAVLLSPSQDFTNQVLMHIDQVLETLPRKKIAQQSWSNYGVIIHVDSLEQAAEISNQFAPEHLQLSVAETELLLPFIKHAGAIFMGYYTPEAIGDYIAGPNHVLPTNRTPRFASGLSTIDFMKRSSLIQCSKESIQHIAPSAVKLADAEGLYAHSLSCQVRIQS